MSLLQSVSANLLALLVSPGAANGKRPGYKLAGHGPSLLSPTLKTQPFDGLDGAAMLIIAAAAAAHAAMASVLGYSIDETYNIVMARTPALSYQDHPPAIMWLVGAAVHLAGSENHFVARLPTLLLTAAQNWLIYRLTALAFSKWAGLFAVLALALSPLFGFYFGAIAVTDGPLLFGLAAAAFVLARGLFNARPMAWHQWVLAGFFFGIACLSKFTAVLVLPGVALFLLTMQRHRRLLLTPGPYVAALTALAVFTPVMVWNAQNGFTAFAYQGSRAALDGTIHIDRFISHIGFVWMVTGPAVWLVQIGTLAGALWRGPRDERSWFFAALAVTPIVFFATIDLFAFEGTGAHWPACGYLFTFPLLGAAVARWRAHFPRLVWGTIGACVGSAGLAALVFVSHIFTGWIGELVPAITSNYDPLVADDTDWRDLPKRLEQDGLIDSRHFLLSGRFEFCYKAKLVIRDRLPVACLSVNPASHSLRYDDGALIGRDAIIIINWWNARQSIAAVNAKFASVEKMPPLWITDHGRPVLRVDLAIGHNLQRPLFEPR